MSSSEEERRIRYDRQVRLWGSGVQQRLHSTILIVSPGSPYYADEALKNLALAGIGKIRIIPDDESNDDRNDAKSFFNQSVVALSSLDSSNNNNNNSSSSTSSSKAQSLVNGLRKLNNLVDCDIFDETKGCQDLYEKDSKEACVIALVDSTSSDSSTNNHWIQKILTVTPINIICNIRFLTRNYAFCDFSSVASDDNEKHEDAAVGTSSSALDNSSLLDQPWTPKSPHPPISVLLKKAITESFSSSKQQSSSSSSFSSFENLISIFQQDKLTSEALDYSEAEIIERVAAEALYLSSSSSTVVSCTLNAVVGAVLAQQVLAHACQVAPAVKQAANNPAGAQPRPVRWLFCSEKPHVECLSGN